MEEHLKEKKAIPSIYWPAFIGGKFCSEQKFTNKKPRVIKGTINQLFIDQGVMIITHGSDNKIELVLSLYEIICESLSDTIIFESTIDHHFIRIHIPEIEN